MSVILAPNTAERTVTVTHKTRRELRAGHGAVSYTLEAAVGRTPLGRLFLFPGLLGCEVSYAQAQHHIAQTQPMEVVALTHGRGISQIIQPKKQRSMNCREVMRDTDRVLGSLPKFIIGHSMGGGDTASVLAHGIRQGERPDVMAIGLDSSVGLNGHMPNIVDGLNFLKEEVLTARGLSGEQRGYMLKTFENYAHNPLLAAAEAVLAATANIRNDVAMIGEHVAVAEFFSKNDRLIPPPADRPHAIIRSEESLGHLALCIEPDVAYEDVTVLLEKAV